MRGQNQGTAVVSHSRDSAEQFVSESRQHWVFQGKVQEVSNKRVEYFLHIYTRWDLILICKELLFLYLRHQTSSIQELIPMHKWFMQFNHYILFFSKKCIKFHSNVKRDSIFFSKNHSSLKLNPVSVHLNSESQLHFFKHSFFCIYHCFSFFFFNAGNLNSLLKSTTNFHCIYKQNT